MLLSNICVCQYEINDMELVMRSDCDYPTDYLLFQIHKRLYYENYTFVLDDNHLELINEGCFSYDPTLVVVSSNNIDIMILWLFFIKMN